MKESNLFIIVTSDRYPDGDAGAIRTHALARIIKECGYTPFVVGMGNTTHFKTTVSDGIKCYSGRFPGNNLIFRACGRLTFIAQAKRIIRKTDIHSVKGFMYVSGGLKLFLWIKKLAEENEIPVYHDSVEWFSASEFSDGEKNAMYQAYDKLNREYIDSSVKVFAISTYLEKYFQGRGVKTCRIPVIMDVQKLNYTKRTRQDVLKITYAGTMGGKDKIPLFLQALEQLSDADLDKIRMYMIGQTLEQYESTFGVLSDRVKKNSVFFTGRIPRKDVLKHLEESDFTLLLRPENERYAQAGFPTKVVESLATATPVICNFTSDLGMYLQDHYNCIQVKDCTVEACAEALRQALQVSPEERKRMQSNARETAIRYFDWHLYVDIVREFMKK